VCLIKTLIFSSRCQWSIIFDNVEEHDSKDSFFCGETDTITKDTRTAHGQKLTWLITTNATDEWMVKKTETNKQAQNRLYEQAQVHTKHFKQFQVFH